MARLFSPAFNQQFFNDDGKPLAAGKLYTYVAGSSTPVFTYKSITGSERNTNPIILDAAGYADFVLELGASYKFVLKDKNDAFKKQWDNVTAADISETLEQLVTDIEGKADKANPATNGHLAELTSDGNLKDSGYKPSDFATKSQGEKADTAYQKPDDGIPKSDMSQGVKDSLDKADSAIQANDLIKFVRVDQRQNFSENERRNGRLNIAATLGIITGANWPLAYEDLLRIFADVHFETLHLTYESYVGNQNPKGITSSLVPRAMGRDYGKVPIVMPLDHTEEGDLGAFHHLEYLSILQACANNSETKLALARGQVPCFKNDSGTFVPYLADVTGVMHLYNVFGVTTQEPFAGDALGKAINTKVVNGNVVQDCLWGKPYGINLFEYELVKWNDCTFGNSSYQVSDSVEMWRQIPFDRSITIKGITLFSYRDATYKSFMKGIYRVDGDNASVISEAIDWTISTSRYLHQPKEVLSKSVIIEGSTPEATPIYAFDITFSPITLEAGNNYLFPCMTAGNNSYSGKGAVMVCYKDASPAMPWETIWTSDENGLPTRGTSTFKGFSYCCRPSLLKVTLSDNTEIWI